jgi:hypothetical protein
MVIHRSPLEFENRKGPQSGGTNAPSPRRHAELRIGLNVRVQANNVNPLTLIKSILAGIEAILFRKQLCANV